MQSESIEDTVAKGMFNIIDALPEEGALSSYAGAAVLLVGGTLLLGMAGLRQVAEDVEKLFDR